MYSEGVWFVSQKRNLQSELLYLFSLCPQTNAGKFNLSNQRRFPSLSLSGYSTQLILGPIKFKITSAADIKLLNGSIYKWTKKMEWMIFILYKLGWFKNSLTSSYDHISGASSSVDGWGATIKSGNSRVSIKSLNFYLILIAALWLWDFST
jgi:hypothetical protein